MAIHVHTLGFLVACSFLHPHIIRSRLCPSFFQQEATKTYRIVLAQFKFILYPQHKTEAAANFHGPATIALCCAEKQETLSHSLVLRPVAYVVYHLSIDLRQILYVAVNIYFTGCSGKLFSFVSIYPIHYIKRHTN
jgi:hypothetical protein